MSDYIVSYDLKKHKDYPRLYAALKQWRAVPLLESFWLVPDLKGPAAAVLDLLRRYIDNDDGIAVIQIVPGMQWCSLRAKTPGENFLLRRFPEYWH